MTRLTKEQSNVSCRRNRIYHLIFITGIPDDQAPEVYFGTIYTHTAVKIEAAHLLTHRKWSDEFIKHATESIHRMSVSDIMSESQKRPSHYVHVFRRLYLALKQLYCDQVVLKHTLPFLYYPDIIVTNIKRREVLDDKMDFKKGGEQNCTVVVLKGISHFGDFQGTKYSRMPAHKLELLEKLGFKVETINWFEICDLPLLRIARKMQLKLDIKDQR